MRVRFIEVAEAIAIHVELIERYGGSHGLRDRGLLESALAQPRATFGNAYLHADLPAMAAAYLYHVVMNHPCIDGNKRLGAALMLAFLALNSRPLRCDQDQLADLVIDVASGRIGKDGIVEFIRHHS